MKPIHKHNCDHCIFLGTYEGSRVGSVDCYWCPHRPFKALSSVSGRYGSEGSEYASSHPPEAFAGKWDYTKLAEGWYLFALIEAHRRGLYTIPQRGRSERIEAEVVRHEACAKEHAVLAGEDDDDAS